MALFEQFGVNPGEVMQRPNGRPVGVRDGMGQRRAQVMNPALQGMQFAQSPVAGTPYGGPAPLQGGGPMPMQGAYPPRPMNIQPVGGITPMQRPVAPQPTAMPQPMGLTNQYAQNVMGKYGMNRGY